MYTLLTLPRLHYHVQSCLLEDCPPHPARAVLAGLPSAYTLLISLWLHHPQWALYFSLPHCHVVQGGFKSGVLIMEVLA